jgi:hypothetical protein
MSDEIASAALQRLLGISKCVLSELAQRGIVKRGDKRGKLLEECQDVAALQLTADEHLAFRVGAVDLKYRLGTSPIQAEGASLSACFWRRRGSQGHRPEARR